MTIGFDGSIGKDPSGAASETVAGVIELSTDAETVTGTATDLATTPANLTAKMSAPGPIGDTTPAEATFTDIEVAGLTSTDLTAYCSVSADANKKLASVAIGTSGQVLTSRGAGLTPTMQDAPADSQKALNYGVDWDESADTYTRTGATAGQATGVTLSDVFLPVQAAMRGCLLNDDGTVNYYLDADDWQYKEDGATASVLTGADCQVMVEIPKFWYRYRYSGTTHKSEVSPVAQSGYFPHPAFYKDGAWVDFRYYGAYEGVLYDTSLTTYVDGIYQTAFSCTFANADSSILANARTAPFKNLTVGQKLTVSGTTSNNATFTVATLVSDTQITVAEALTNETAASTVIQTQKDFTATTGDVLSSVSGFAPITYVTRSQMRVLASNRGAGWRQADYDLCWAVQLLFVTAYASFYSQSVLGAGITSLSSGEWSTYNDYNPITRTGNGNGIGNASGNTAGSASAATEVTKYLKYRGIENFYGHLWEWVDGININNDIPYRTNNATDWADDTTTNYERMTNILGADVTLHNVSGYPATLQKMKFGFLPASVGASTSTKLTDYYWRAAAWRVGSVGGSAYNGGSAGAFCVSAGGGSGTAYLDIAGRICF